MGWGKGNDSRARGRSVVAWYGRDLFYFTFESGDRGAEGGERQTRRRAALLSASKSTSSHRASELYSRPRSTLTCPLPRTHSQYGAWRGSRREDTGEAAKPAPACAQHQEIVGDPAKGQGGGRGRGWGKAVKGKGHSAWHERGTSQYPH